MAAKKRDPRYWKPAPAGGRYYGGASTAAPAKKTAAKKTTGGPPRDAAPRAAAKKAPAKSAAKNAAAAEVAGGGPEDPLADAVAFKEITGSTHKVKAPKAGKAFGKSNPARWVLVEFLVCFVILGLGTIVAPEGQKNGGAPHLAVKGSALALLFFILGLMSGGGAKSAKAAGALGGLVTAAYLFTSQDSANLITWVDGFFTAPQAAKETVGPLGAAATRETGAGVSSGVAGAAQ